MACKWGWSYPLTNWDDPPSIPPPPAVPGFYSANTHEGSMGLVYLYLYILSFTNSPVILVNLLGIPQGVSWIPALCDPRRRAPCRNCEDVAATVYPVNPANREHHRCVVKNWLRLSSTTCCEAGRRRCRSLMTPGRSWRPEKKLPRFIK